MSENPRRSQWKASRLFSIDALRGLIMILMALDHANHFIAQKHSTGEYFGGPFPTYSDALTFLTRLLTHPAAPGFFFLMGVGMSLFVYSRRQRGWSRWAIVQHFVIRGAVLIALQLFLVNRAWELSPSGWGIRVYVGVLAALGSGMILASLLVWLKRGYLLALLLILFVGTELLTPAPSLWGARFPMLMSVLLVPAGRDGWWVNYPILQWLDLVVLGLVFGQWLAADPRKAYHRALALGGSCVVGFAAIRFLDSFGNIRPRLGNTWIDWLNPVKYPPSMTFTLMTTGVNLILLWAFSRAGERGQRILQPLSVFGRAPLLFYILHLFLYAGIAHALIASGLVTKGTSIPAMVPFWILGLVILFPLSWHYGQFKRRQPANSIWRFF